MLPTNIGISCGLDITKSFFGPKNGIKDWNEWATAKGVETKLRPEHFGKLESLYGTGKTNKLYIGICQNSFTLQAI